MNSTPTFLLPDLFSKSKDPRKDPATFYHYITNNNTTKAKVTLQTNLINFLIEGEKKLHSSGQSLHLSAGSFAMVKTGNSLMTEKVSANSKYESLLLFYSNDIVNQFLRSHNNPVLNKQPNPFLIYNNDAFINNYVSSIILLTQQHEIPLDLKVIKLLELFSYLANQYGNEFLSFLADSPPTRQAHFKGVIENNRFEKLSITELAFLCNMSESTFKRKFYEVYGTTPSKWFTDQRLSYASYLLTTNNHKASEIFIEVGFESQSSFTQAFRKKYDVTPAEYQRMNVSKQSLNL